MEIPWRNVSNFQDVGKLKNSNPLSTLCTPLGQPFVEIATHIQSLGYADAPDYGLIKRLLQSAIPNTPVPFEWMIAHPKDPKVKPLKGSQFDPTGFLLEIAPFWSTVQKNGDCLLL